MKINLYKFLIIVIIISLLNCSYEDGSLEDDEYSIRITGINFGGNWSHLSTPNRLLRYLELTMRNEPVIQSPIKPSPLIIEFDSYKKPYVKNLETRYSTTIKSTGTWTDYSTFIIESVFKDATEDILFSPANLKVRWPNKFHYDFSLTYNANSESILTDANITVEGIYWGFVPKALQYNVDWEFVHRATHNNGSKDGNINFVVMAEGYRYDQIDEYAEYVRDAFANPANFHYCDDVSGDHHIHITNDFFARYWDRINVIMLKTVSPEEGISHNCGYQERTTILNMNAYEYSHLKAGDFSRISAIMYHTRPNDMDLYDADAYIILVNDHYISGNPPPPAFSYPYGMEIGYRKCQPIHPVVVKAHVGYDINASNFHIKVGTNAIAHELGHALARLQDEYAGSGKAGYFYQVYYRNVDKDTNVKWQWFMDNGYNVGIFRGAFYNDCDYYRPSEEGTMRYSSSNVQFNAVNTYHLTATFKARMGELNINLEVETVVAGQITQGTLYSVFVGFPAMFLFPLDYDDNSLYFEWPGYKYSQFKQEWPPVPSKF